MTSSVPQQAAPGLEAQSVETLHGVGPQLAQKLSRLGIRMVQDVLFHLPFRYQDRTRVTPIGSLVVGREAVVVGRIELASLSYGRRRSLLARISDGTGALTMRLFYFSAAQQKSLKKGRWVRLFGEVRMGPSTLEMIHPEYSVSDAEPGLPDEQSLTPIYPTTDGVSQRVLRRLTDAALARAENGIREWLPADVRRRFGYASITQALRFVHRPPADCERAALEQGHHPAQQRLAFEELLSHHLSLRRLREQRQSQSAAAMSPPGELLLRFRDNLAFELTGAQQRVMREVIDDLSKETPALRLIQGDVGSGKTVVAAAAALWAIEAGFQVAVMAPTELLAEQHRESFSRWFEPLGIEVYWLTGRLPVRERRAALAALADGDAAITVGTHALFQQGVAFARLGLIVVDEQHRFGVDQRLALFQKGERLSRVPHQLTMTATPIPRSLAMTFYADLDVSNLDEMPPGRKPVETVVVPESRRTDVLARVRRACREGRQAYWVCALIDESESLEVQAATDTESALKEALPELRIDLVHGRMKANEKDGAMRRFRAGETDLLVATTVIEVGVDVPRASLMIIENAERLGLSQLHQLRGRVGRGSERACCVLMYRAPLSSTARERLAVLRRTNDGFEVARRDLEQRGPGEVLGTRQTGLQQLHIADLVRDRALLPQVEEAARHLRRHCPDHIDPLVRRWVRAGEAYGRV